jgi:hypothetical protein
VTSFWACYFKQATFIRLHDLLTAFIIEAITEPTTRQFCFFILSFFILKRQDNYQVVLSFVFFTWHFVASTLNNDFGLERFSLFIKREKRRERFYFLIYFSCFNSDPRCYWPIFSVCLGLQALSYFFTKNYIKSRLP